jgi:hypothetical protein
MGDGKQSGEKNMEKGPVILFGGIPMTSPSVLGILKFTATNIIFGKYKDDQGK